MLKNIKKACLIALAATVFGGCSYRMEIPDGFPTPEPPPPATPAPKIDPKPDAELEKQIADIAEAAKGKVGVAAVVLETGGSATLNADQRFPMLSVYKLPIAMAVMDQVRLGKLDLDEQIGVTREDMVREGQHSPLRDKNPNGGEFTIRELIRLALVASDGTASDVLMRVAGEAPEIQSFLTQIGIRDMHVVNTEKEIGRDWETQYQNWATPTAAVELLHWLNANADGWKPPNLNQELIGSQIILQDMMKSNPGAKRLKGQLPLLAPVSVIAHKTGTSGTQNGITAATNDIGLIYLPNGKRLAIAVFVSDSSADERTREAVIAKIARAAWDRWAKN